MLFIGRECVKKHPQDLACLKQRLFSTQLTSQWSMNMIKIMLCRFQQCFGTFTMFLVEGSSERRVLDIYLTTFSESVISEIQNQWRLSFFSKYLKFIVNFKNAAKKWAKLFYIWDNWIWIGTVKFSVLRTGYFSSTASVLTSSPKIWHVMKRPIFKLNCLGSDQRIW